MVSLRCGEVEERTYSRIAEVPVLEEDVTSIPSPRYSSPNINVKSSKLSSLGAELSEDDVSACLGMAKAIEILGAMESIGACAVETTSVYGAAIAIPQIGRSALWPKTMFWLSMRAYVFLVLNYVIQTMFVYYIYDSQTNMNPYGGQMHLCDFGSHVANCPNNKDCHGPGGTEIPNPGNLYPYDIWNTRKFVRDGMQALFPDMKDKIDSNFDPGEYGVESYYCRLICIFLFMVAIADEFQNIRDLVKLLYYLPTNDNQLWVQYDPPQWASKQHVKDVNGVRELEFVRFKVNGMPLRWKIINLVVVLLPKIFIWRMLTMAGVHFLMETAAMVDQIVNTTALQFVFTTDELILDRLTTKATRHIMSNLQDYDLFDNNQYEEQSDQECLETYAENEMTWTMGARDWWLLPRRLFWAVGLTIAFLAEYYCHNCKRMGDGSLVSTDQYYPPDAHLDIGSFVLKFFSLSVPYGTDVSQAFWTMPVSNTGD